MAAPQRIAIISVYDKTGLLDLAKGLVNSHVRILGSGGTARMIRESGFPGEYVLAQLHGLCPCAAGNCRVAG